MEESRKAELRILCHAKPPAPDLISSTAISANSCSEVASRGGLSRQAPVSSCATILPRDGRDCAFFLIIELLNAQACYLRVILAAQVKRQLILGINQLRVKDDDADNRLAGFELVFNSTLNDFDRNDIALFAKALFERYSSKGEF